MIGELWARSAAKLGVAIALGALAPAGLVAAAPASGADAQDKGYLESTVRFLQEAQNPDGGFGATRSGPSDTDISAWAAIGLAAAGINPQEQARPGGRSVYDYLTEHADELSLTTDFERELLVVDAAGTSPYDFGGVDLVQRILERKVRGSGAFTHEEGQAAAQDVSDTVFAILALSPIHEPEVQEAVQGATKWLIEQQGPAKGPGEGSWNATCLPSMPACIEGEGPQGEVDMTAAAVEALNAAGNHGSEAQANALAFLHRAQESDEGDGGFREFFPGDLDEAPANAGSTSWAVQALWSAGENPESGPWLAPGTGERKNPLQYLRLLQHANGSIGYLAGESEGSVWMTAYTAVTFAGLGLPVPVAPPHPPSPPQVSSPPTDPHAAPVQSQQSAAQPRHARGVIVGGGGRGARLFSRPQPGGQGSGRGPVRRSEDVEAVASPPAVSGARSSAGAHSRPQPRQTPPKRPERSASPVPPGAASGSPGGQPDAPAVTGVLLDEPLAAHLQPPGLRSAQVAQSDSSTTTAIIAALVLLVIAGARLERRRLRTIS